MTDDDPLEGDIGPAPSVKGRAEETQRDETEREERRQRTNAVSGRVALILVALLLGFLAYDSITTAFEARDRGDPWLYPPATVAAVCLIGLVTLLGWALRHRR